MRDHLPLLTPRKAETVDTTHYDRGTAAERWERVQMFFNAKEYTAAAHILATLADETPERVGPRLMLARPYYHSAQLQRAEMECARSSSSTPWSSTPG
jgi:hypothetical protein